MQTKLRGEGGIKALLGMVKCGHPDVLAQVARGIANFSKCESRASIEGVHFLGGYFLKSFDLIACYMTSFNLMPG